MQRFPFSRLQSHLVGYEADTSTWANLYRYYLKEKKMTTIADEGSLAIYGNVGSKPTSTYPPLLAPLSEAAYNSKITVFSNTRETCPLIILLDWVLWICLSERVMWVSYLQLFGTALRLRALRRLINDTNCCFWEAEA